MNLEDKKVDRKGKEIFEKYHETHYKDLQGWRDYNLTSAGYGTWYYDCLPADKKARVLDIGCGDGKFLFFNSGRNGNYDVYWVDAKIIDTLKMKHLKDN